jgi:hypothetical protein
MVEEDIKKYEYSWQALKDFTEGTLQLVKQLGSWSKLNHTWDEQRVVSCWEKMVRMPDGWGEEEFEQLLALYRSGSDETQVRPNIAWEVATRGMLLSRERLYSYWKEGRLRRKEPETVDYPITLESGQYMWMSSSGSMHSLSECWDFPACVGVKCPGGFAKSAESLAPNIRGDSSAPTAVVMQVVEED